MRGEQLPEPHYVIEHAELSYGETVVKADSIELYPEGKEGLDGTGALRPGTGFAHGHVQLTDPVGVLSAEEAFFNWIDHTGKASNALVTFEGIQLSAAGVEVEPGIWTLDGIRASLAHGRPIGYILAGHAVLRPGVGFSAYSLDATLFGSRLGGIHHADYTLGGHFGGDRFPVPTLSGDRGFGLRYRPIYLIDDRTAIAGSANVSQTAPPSYGLQTSRSFLPAGEAHGLVVPRSELDMRFDFGYFDTLGVESPTDEHDQISRPRDNLSADIAYNVQAFDRKGDEVFAKPFETTFERSLSKGGFALLTDNTFQQIHSLGGSDHARFLNFTTIGMPLIRLAPTLTSRIRFDGASFLGGSGSFSWVHSQLGLVYRPSDSIRFGVAYIAGRQFGTPLYQVDELYSVNGVDVRLDYDIGPHRFSLLGKYDTDRRRWYDREILVAQNVGPIQVFARLRTFPSQLIFGGELRLDSIVGELLKRNPGLPSPAPKLVD